MNATDNDDERFDEDQIQKACFERYGYRAKPFQIAAARSLHQGKDTVVIAPTGSGKSLVMTLPFLSKYTYRQAMVVVITPLKALQKEQAAKDITAVYVNADNKTKELLAEIAAKKYRLIFVGPEMMQRKEFRKILRDPSWSRDVLGYFVDEAHVVVSWGGSFRPIYKTLGEIRHLESRRIPITAMSATIPTDTYRQLASDLELRRPTIINIGSARQNIHLSFLPFSHSMDGFRDIIDAMPELVKYKIGGEYLDMAFRNVTTDLS